MSWMVLELSEEVQECELLWMLYYLEGIWIRSGNLELLILECRGLLRHEKLDVGL